MKERINEMECSGGVYVHNITPGNFCSLWVRSNYSLLPAIKINSVELGFLEDEEIKIIIGEFTKFFGGETKFISPLYKQVLIINTDSNKNDCSIIPYIDWEMQGKNIFYSKIYVVDYSVFHYLISIFFRNVEIKHIEKIIPYPQGGKYAKQLKELNPEDIYNRLINNNKLDGLLVADTETEGIDVLNLNLCYLLSQNEEAQEELKRLKQRYVPLFRYKRGDIYLGLLPDKILTEEEYQRAFHNNMEWKNYIKKCLGNSKDEIARAESLRLFTSIWNLILDRSIKLLKYAEVWR